MAYTPGPWYRNGDCIEADGPEGPRDVTVATVTPLPSHWFGNSLLLAAAPDMLAALEAFRDAYNCGNVDDPRRSQRIYLAYRLATDAINKACPPDLEVSDA